MNGLARTQRSTIPNWDSYIGRHFHRHTSYLASMNEDDIPSDLVALPTMPYSERPVELPLDVEEVRTAIWMAAGNISEAAKLLKVTSIRLRAFVKKSPYLTAEMQEAQDRLVDIAEANVYSALTDAEDPSRRDTMSRFVLTNIGKHRGWGTAGSGGVTVKNSAGGTIVVQWADGTQLGSEPEQDSRTIEGEVIGSDRKLG